MSDRSGAGFENKIAELMASRLGLPLEYRWFPMATGFIRKTLQANACDVVIAGPRIELVLNTNHYYTSAYVLIVASNGPLAGVTTLADPLLKDKRIGIIAGDPSSDAFGKKWTDAQSEGVSSDGQPALRGSRR